MAIPLEILQFGAQGNTGWQLAEALGYTDHSKKLLTLLLTVLALTLRLPWETGSSQLPGVGTYRRLPLGRNVKEGI